MSEFLYLNHGLIREDCDRTNHLRNIMREIYNPLSRDRSLARMVMARLTNQGDQQ